MDKKRQINFNLNGFLIPISSMLDYIQKHKKIKPLSHSKRVAYMALNIGIKLDFTPEELFDLCAYSLCHNIGLNQSYDDKSYCELSNKYVKDFPFLRQLNDILKYQKEKFDGNGVFSLKGDEIPLFSQILYLVTYIEDNYDLTNLSVEQKYELLENVKDKSDTFFSKKLVNIFEEVSSNITFWLDLKNEQELILFIYNSLHDFTKPIDFEELLNISSVFSDIENPDSKLSFFIKKMAEYYEFEHKDILTLQISATLARIGKLTIKNELLNKIDKLNKYELEEIRTYPYYTKKVLFNIMGFSDIATSAIKIQERIDGSGYCFNLEGKHLSFKDRLLAVLNIYDALRQKRAYRDSFSHEAAIEIMKEEANKNKIDKALVEDINNILKES